MRGNCARRSDIARRPSRLADSRGCMTGASTDERPATTERPMRSAAAWTGLIWMSCAMSALATGAGAAAVHANAGPSVRSTILVPPTPAPTSGAPRSRAHDSPRDPAPARPHSSGPHPARPSPHRASGHHSPLRGRSGGKGGRGSTSFGIATFPNQGESTRPSANLVELGRRTALRGVPWLCDGRGPPCSPHPAPHAQAPDPGVNLTAAFLATRTASVAARPSRTPRSSSPMCRNPGRRLVRPRVRRLEGVAARPFVPSCGGVPCPA